LEYVSKSKAQERDQLFFSFGRGLTRSSLVFLGSIVNLLG
jgi:hypothetical protein